MTQKIVENVYSVGAIDPSRKLFDALIPLPNGTSYNSYIIIGQEKTALIDSVDPKFYEVLSKNIEELSIKKIDYIIANHAEQDHSGSIPNLLSKFPESKVYCSEKCKQLLIDLLGINSDRIIIVKDKEQLALGGKTLEFIYTPWVHWPETMCTYLKCQKSEISEHAQEQKFTTEDKILFSCDFFGAHYASNDLFFYDEKIITESAKRYYAEIISPFRNFVKKNIETLKKYEIEMIAPSHGVVYKNPLQIIKLHEEWSSDETKNLAVIVYVSMHGSTEEIAQIISKKLIEKNVEVKLFNLEKDDVGELLSTLLDAKTIVVGSPCFHAGLHPNVANMIYLINSLRPKTKYFSFFGSYAWGEKMFSEAQSMIKSFKPEVLPPLLIKGKMKDSDSLNIDSFVDEIVKKHKL